VERKRNGTSAEATMISIRLTNAVLARLRRVAADQDRTLSAVCRRLIVRGLPDEERQPKLVEPG